MQVHTIGIDLAKNVFQVHGVNELHEVVWICLEFIPCP